MPICSQRGGDPSADLPPEIWTSILAMLGGRELHAVCIVCRLFRVIALPHLYHDPFSLTETTKSLSQLLQTLEDPYVCSLIAVYRDNADSMLKLKPSPTVLRGMTNIRRAVLEFSLLAFIDHCPSRSIVDLRLNNRDTSHGPTVSAWLEDLTDLRHLTWLGNPLYDIHSLALPNLITLACESDVARLFLRGSSNAPLLAWFDTMQGWGVEFIQIVPLLPKTVRTLNLRVAVIHLEEVLNCLRWHVPQITTLALRLVTTYHMVSPVTLEGLIFLSTKTNQSVIFHRAESPYLDTVWLGFTSWRSSRSFQIFIRQPKTRRNFRCGSWIRGDGTVPNFFGQPSTTIRRTPDPM